MENAGIQPQQNIATAPPVQASNTASNLILGLLVLVAVAIFATVGWLYWRNRSLTTQLGQQNLTIQTPNASVEPEVTSAADEWNTYSDTQFKFSLEYPLEYPTDYVETQVYLNRRITWYATYLPISEQPSEPRPTITSEQATEIPLPGSSRLVVEYSTAGGAIPHEEVLYQVPNPQSVGEDDKYVIFKLSAAPIQMTAAETASFARQTEAVKLSPADIEVFDAMMETVAFE